jgi:deazaflavin-dependent oxidoreductase (nitroreductase family)
VAIPHGEDLAVIGSNFGGARTPGWVHNLKADPRVSVMHGLREVPALASPVRGEEAEQVWATATSLYVGYAQYRQRAAHREITVWVLRLGAGTAPSA